MLRALFETGQHFDIDILPRHFYSEIPDIRVLKSNTRWRVARSMQGIRGDIVEQIAWVDRCTKDYRTILGNFEVHRKAVAMNGSNQGYGEVEADFLYCFIRAIRPMRIVQVGCGVSTAVCLLAAKDEGYAPTIICIEPYPTEFLKHESAAGRIELVVKKAEDAGTDYVSSLNAGDLFFVDSSHTLAPAGEANLLILEWIQKVPAGAFVHFHDIYFPYDYAPDTLSTALFFSHETALLYAFLLMNDRFEIAASLALMHHMRLDKLVEFFPDMKPHEFEDGLTKKTGHFPSSIFLRCIKSPGSDEAASTTGGVEM